MLVSVLKHLMTDSGNAGAERAAGVLRRRRELWQSAGSLPGRRIRARGRPAGRCGGSRVQRDGVRGRRRTWRDPDLHPGRRDSVRGAPRGRDGVAARARARRCARASAAGRPEWAPEFEFVQLGSPAEVEALDGSPRKDAEVGMWAWIDEEAGVLRERVFAEPFGIPEDEATGAAAVTLTARLGRALDIRQGRGSRIQTRPLEDGMVEIAGRVEFEEVRDYGS